MGKSRFRETKLNVALLFNNYDGIFHVNNCKAAFAASCVSVPILSLSIFFHPMVYVIDMFFQFVSFLFIV